MISKCNLPTTSPPFPHRLVPEPLLTKALSDHFTSILSNYDTDSETIPDTPTLQSLTNLCASSQFPLEHRHTLAILCKHLQSIAKNAAVNKMGISNLTIVWSPTSGMAPNVLAFFIRFWEKVIPLPVAVAPIARVVSPFGLAAAHRPNSFPSPAVKPSNKPPPPPPPPSKASRLANNSSNNNDPASFPQTPPSTTSSSSPSTSPSRDDDNNNIKQTVCRQSFPSTTSSPPHYSTYSSQSSQQSLSPPVAPRPVTHRPASSTLQNVVADFQQQASISGWDKFSLKPT